MLIGYFLLILLLVFQGSLYLIKKTSINKEIFLFFSFIDVLFLAMFRNPFFVTDDMNYLEIFWGYAPCYFEFGLGLLNKIIILLGSDTYVYFGSLAFCIFSSIWLFVNKYSNNIFLSILAFVGLMYIYNSVNVVRQFLAISIILYSFPFIIQRRFYVFLCFVFAACCFHYSAIVCIIFYWLYDMKASSRNVCCIVFISLIAFIFFEYISEIWTSLDLKYSKYISSEAENTRLSGVIRFILNFIITCTSLCIIKFVPSFKLKFSKLNMNFLVLSSCIATSASFISLNAYWTERLAYYFYIFNIIILPEMVNFISNKNIKILMYFIVAICIIAYGAVVLWSWQQKGKIFLFIWQ